MLEAVVRVPHGWLSSCGLLSRLLRDSIKQVVTKYLDFCKWDVISRLSLFENYVDFILQCLTCLTCTVTTSTKTVVMVTQTAMTPGGKWTVLQPATSARVKLFLTKLFLALSNCISLCHRRNLTQVKSVCETARKSLSWDLTCVSGFEYASWLVW